MLVQQWGEERCALLKTPPVNVAITECKDAPNRREKSRRCHFGRCTRVENRVLWIEKRQHPICTQSKRDVMSDW